MKKEIKVIDNTFSAESRQAKVFVHEREHLNLRALYTMAMIERWGMVAAESDGEDSAGRAMMRRSRAEEVVSFAVECTELAFAEMEKRDWITIAPSVAEMDAMFNKETATA